MNFADPFKQLVERKLWPIALLLVAALVAVPFLLAKPAEDSPLPPSTASLASGPGASDSIVNVGDPDSREDVRAVLGARKDPFRPAQLHRVEKPEDALTEPGVPTSVGGDTGTTAAGDPVGPADPTDPTAPDVDPNPEATEVPTADPQPDPDPQPTFDLYSLQVRFGPTEGELVTENVERLTGLGDEQEPVALYLGLSEDRQSAVFLVDAGTEVVGDGRCDPSPENCQTLVLKPGETVFFTRDEEQFELDLIKINVSKTTDAAAARKSRVAVADGGRRALRHFNGTGGYRYSKATGTLRRVQRSSSARRGLKATGSKLLLSSTG